MSIIKTCKDDLFKLLFDKIAEPNSHTTEPTETSLMRFQSPRLMKVFITYFTDILGLTKSAWH